MKIRQGFVSNSSSSSFVIIGYEMGRIFPKDNKSEKEALVRKYAPNIFNGKTFKEYGVDEVWIDFLYGTNFGIEGVGYLGDDGPGYMGVILADIKSEASDIKNYKISIKDVMSKVKALQEVFGISEEPKIITGTRSC